VLCRRHFRTGAALPARATCSATALAVATPHALPRWAWAVPEKRERSKRNASFSAKLQRKSITICNLVYNLRQMLITTQVSMSCGMALGCSAVVPSHQVTLCSYCWTGHKPGWDLSDSNPAVLGQIYFLDQF
jgi:hypothetical protein